MKLCSVCQRCYDDAAVSCEEKHGSLVRGRSGTRQMIANYRLEALLGRDGTSEIYQATNTNLRKFFSLKITNLNPLVNTTQSRQRFQTETQIAVGMDHQHIALVYESGSLGDNELYVVSELIAGQTVGERLTKVGSLTETEAVTIAQQAAEALDAAHHAGLFHRAVNPANLFLSRNEPNLDEPNDDSQNHLTVKLQNFDFGGINQQISVASLTDPNLPSNALPYLSPEQIGAAETVDARTDIYSLGTVLYQMLCGRPPFDAPISAEAQSDKPINELLLSRLHFDTRALLTHLLKHSLKTKPSVRLQTAANFALQLRHIKKALPQSAENLRFAVARKPLSKAVTSAAAVAASGSQRSPISNTSELIGEKPPSSETNPSLSAETVAALPEPTAQVGDQSAAAVTEEPVAAEPSSKTALLNEPEATHAGNVKIDMFAAEPVVSRKKEIKAASFESEPIFDRKKQVAVAPVAAPSPGIKSAAVKNNKISVSLGLPKTVVPNAALVKQLPAAKLTKSVAPLFTNFDQANVASRRLLIRICFIALISLAVAGALFYQQLQQAFAPLSNANANAELPTNADASGAENSPPPPPANEKTPKPKRNGRRQNR